MIHEVDDALRALLRAEALDRTSVSVVFDAPTRDWAAKVNAPTVNLYLYDIREDMRRRERGLYNEYDDSGVVVARRRPPRYFKLSYLLTAWTKRPEDEHRLLSELLNCLLRYEALPPERVTGALAELGVPVPLSIALPPPEDRSFADVWSALGGELKPSLDVVVSVPLTASPRYAAGPPAEDGLQLSLDDFEPPPRPDPSRPGEKPLYGRPDRELARRAMTRRSPRVGDGPEGGPHAGSRGGPRGGPHGGPHAGPSGGTNGSSSGGSEDGDA